ncbi:unnamed protein product [Peniophora sp. CBMAI 1063]|nr:unnamed protein product [Peniophora sp. CBMAI 1063]
MNHISVSQEPTGVYFAALYAETLTYGIYCPLFALCMLKLGRDINAKDSNLRRAKRPKVLLICLTIMMFCVGTTHSAIFLRQASTSTDVEMVSKHRSRERYEYSKLLLGVVNCLLGDLIILYTAFRMETIIGRTRPSSCSTPGCTRIILYIFPSLFLLASLGIGMLSTCDGVDVIAGQVQSPSLRSWPGAWLSLVLATNVISTLVFAYEYTTRGMQHKAERVLYCCMIAILLVLFIVNVNVRYVFSHILPQLAGIYPTGVVVVVAISTNDPAINLLPLRTRA